MSRCEMREMAGKALIRQDYCLFQVAPVSSQIALRRKGFAAQRCELEWDFARMSPAHAAPELPGAALRRLVRPGSVRVAGNDPLTSGEPESAGPHRAAQLDLTLPGAALPVGTADERGADIPHRAATSRHSAATAAASASPQSNAGAAASLSPRPRAACDRGGRCPCNRPFPTRQPRRRRTSCRGAEVT